MGKRVYPLKKSVRQQIALEPPVEPAHIKEGFKLTLKDLPRYKEPIVSPKMQKNLRILDLRIDPEGFLYSPKSYDPEWNWQSQAIWLRTIGVGIITISKRLDKKLTTVKRMFGRLKALTPFYRGVSHNDWATIGNSWVGDYGSKKVRKIKFGGAVDQSKLLGDEISDMRGTVDFDKDEVIIDQRSGQIYEKVGSNSGLNNRFTTKKQPESTYCPIKHHESVSDPVHALEQTVISFDAYNEQEKQLQAYEKRKEVKHNKGKHTPRSKHPQEKVAAGHGLSTKPPHTGKNFGRKKISIQQKILELSNWKDYGGN